MGSHRDFFPYNGRGSAVRRWRCCGEEIEARDGIAGARTWATLARQGQRWRCWGEEIGGTRRVAAALTLLHIYGWGQQQCRSKLDDGGGERQQIKKKRNAATLQEYNDNLQEIASKVGYPHGTESFLAYTRQFNDTTISTTIAVMSPSFRSRGVAMSMSEVTTPRRANILVCNNSNA